MYLRFDFFEDTKNCHQFQQDCLIISTLLFLLASIVKNISLALNCRFNSS